MPQAVGFIAGGFGFTAAGAGAFAAGTAAGAAFVSTAVGNIVFNLGVSVVATALSRALGPKPERAPATGARTETTLAGGVNPASFGLGSHVTAGTHVCPPMSHGEVDKTPNAYLTYVIELSDIPGQQIEALWINNEKVTFTGASPHADYGSRILGRFEDRAWIKYWDGTQASADPMLLSKYGSGTRNWTAGMVGRGIGYAILTFRFDREVFQSFPQVKFQLTGIPLYNPAKDSSAGGSGSHRHNNPATWEPSNNPAVQAYNVLRGIPLPSGDIWGGDIGEDDLPYAVWAAAISECDKPVDNGALGTEPQFRAGIEVMADDEPFDIALELLLPAMGNFAEVGGTWKLRIGAPSLPVMAFTDDDIWADSVDDYRPFPSIGDVYNAIEISHPDPDAAWNMRDAPGRYNATWEAEDGGRRLIAGLSMTACPYPVQVQRVGAALIEDHRRMRVHEIELPPPAIILEPLDTVAWTSDINGYTSKLFEVLHTTRDIPTGRVSVRLREIDPDDYNPPSGLFIPDVPNVGPIIPLPQAVPGWDVQPYTIIDANSNQRRPALRIFWDPDAAEDARGLRFAIKLDGEAGDGVIGPMLPVMAGMATITDVLPNTPYSVRARFITDRATSWSPWKSATTPDIRLDYPDLTASIADDLADLHDWIDEGISPPEDFATQALTIREALDRIRKVAAGAAETGAIAHEHIVEVNDAVASAQQVLSSSIDTVDDKTTINAEAITAVQAALGGKANATAVSALSTTVQQHGGTLTSHGQAITGLESTINDPSTGLATRASASALNNLSTDVGANEDWISSIAQALTKLGATVDENTAETTFRMTTEVTPAGALARIGLKATASGTEGDARAAALFLEARSGNKNRVIIDADQFYATGGSGDVPVLVVSGGNVGINASLVRLTSATTVDPSFEIQGSSATGKMVLRPTGIYIYDGSNNLRVRIGKSL